jgi:hypothetical protein
MKYPAQGRDNPLLVDAVKRENGGAIVIAII